jgi:deoxycytidylate deaminase
MDKSIPLHKIYSQREEFVIVALTGITGSGCSDFADMMSKDFKQWQEENLIRSYEEIAKLPSENKQGEVFKREYQRCYQVSKYYEPFKVIKYKNVLILYVLKELFIKYQNVRIIVEHLAALLGYKFHHSHQKKDLYSYNVDSDFSVDTIMGWGLTNSLIEKLSQIATQETRFLQKEKEGKDANERYLVRKMIANLFFDSEFEQFCGHLYEELKQRDYYSKNFFVHRLATAIRTTGDSEKNYPDFKSSHDSEHVFDLVELINQIIKGYHANDRMAPRRFVIDSVRNSLEILYLRERYNAFYMVALHNDGYEKELLRKKVSCYAEGQRIEDICANISSLSDVENRIKSFEHGQFFAPDLQRCVSESELHVAYNTKEDLKKELCREEKNLEFTSYSFYTYTEQWMKYSALISRPGLVAPTRDERCMSIAYVAKFNSGCISRQVGCAIIDKERAVQSVGWNDPPASQLPCNLRDVNDLYEAKKTYDEACDKDKKSLFEIYSKFELGDSKEYPKHDEKGNPIGIYGKGFSECVNQECSGKTSSKLAESGLKYAYCFRSRYNTYKENKDAVNTRSLHAEENTMLRLARQGGMGLNGGTMYVTASPCVLCSKKAYQIGIRDIVYLDPYTDIAPDLILNCGYDIPRLRAFRGAIGGTFYKLYQPFIPYKDEIKIWEEITKTDKV